MISHTPSPLFFFFNDTATTEIYTLSLHDALPIFLRAEAPSSRRGSPGAGRTCRRSARAVAARDRERGRAGRSSPIDRKSTRLNSSHVRISYAVFCLKKKTKKLRRHVCKLNTTTAH